MACRTAEIVNANAADCEACPSIYWPDDSGTAWRTIPPSYLRFSDPISAALLSLAAVGTAITVPVIVVYVRSDHRLIRSTNRGLSLTILVGTLAAYATVVGFVAPPTHAIYAAHIIGFDVGINLLYPPLLIKNVCIYRVFDASRRSVRPPPFIGRKWQAAVTAVAVGVQVWQPRLSTGMDVVILNFSL